jgi:hypothetical protein
MPKKKKEVLSPEALLLKIGQNPPAAAAAPVAAVKEEPGTASGPAVPAPFVPSAAVPVGFVRTVPSVHPLFILTFPSRYRDSVIIFFHPSTSTAPPDHHLACLGC